MRKFLHTLLFWAALSFAAAGQIRVGVADNCPEAGGCAADVNYLNALLAAGYAPVVLPDIADSLLLADAVSAVELVLLTGGEDIDPARFGEAPDPALGTVNARRDAFEFRLIREALRQGKPIFGICRGMQVLNVYFGGSLWQDLPSGWPGCLDHRSPDGHGIRIVPGSRMAAWVGTETLKVNTRHHQAVRRVAPGFRISAYAPDGVPEAFECDSLPIAAVQFHPERLALDGCTDLKDLFARIFVCTGVPRTGGKLPQQYEELPLGSIRAEGWLLEMLTRQRDGITANLDTIYPEVCGERNGWLGGDGDQWERGPYWIDGLLPMAYILDDAALKAKAQRWVEWALASQTEDGQFGPRTDYAREPGIQRTHSLDWWPRMVVLKILQQYYNATQDARVLTFLDKYFRYQLATLPEKPIGHWTPWAEFRAGDNMLVALWLYRKTGEPYLLDLCDLLHRQGWDFTGMFLDSNDLGRRGSIHCVNLAQGLKEPVIYWQARGGQRYLDAMERCNAQMRLHGGWPIGMFGGDEALHGNNPTQGSELCSAVELMYSFEEMLKVTGRLEMAEHLERVAFNALPAQNSDDFHEHQYFQQANQVHICRGPHNFDIVYNGTASLMGVLCGYPCCLCNLHQGWPKFTQNLWYRTEDGAFAALCYAPCSFTAEVDGIKVGVRENTCYPMDGKIRIEFSLPRRKRATIALKLRIPSWTQGAVVRVNGEEMPSPQGGSLFEVSRSWKNGDSIELEFPMQVKTSNVWYENAVSVERGPLVYALKIDEKWEKIALDPKERKGAYYWQVSPLSPWNYAFLRKQVDKPAQAFSVELDEEKLKRNWYWNAESAPVRIRVNAARVKDWTEYNGDAGPLPYSFVRERIYNGTSSHRSNGLESVLLIPYGCTTLRISEFPVLSR